MSLPELAKSCQFWDCIDLIRELVLFHLNARDIVMTEKKDQIHKTQQSAITAGFTQKIYRMMLSQILKAKFGKAPLTSRSLRLLKK